MSIEYCNRCKMFHPDAHECEQQITTGGIVKPTPTREEYTLGKLREMTEGKRVIMSDEELDLLGKFDVSNVIRSIPNPKQVGTKDRYECWIEQRDLKRFNAAQFDADLAESDE